MNLKASQQCLFWCGWLFRNERKAEFLVYPKHNSTNHFFTPLDQVFKEMTKPKDIEQETFNPHLQNKKIKRKFVRNSVLVFRNMKKRMHLGDKRVHFCPSEHFFLLINQQVVFFHLTVATVMAGLPVCGLLVNRARTEEQHNEGKQRIGSTCGSDQKVI